MSNQHGQEPAKEDDANTPLSSPAIKALEEEEREFSIISKVCREKARHENELTNHRLSWNFTIQGFLFAAYGICVQTMGYLQTKIADVTISNTTDESKRQAIDALKNAARDVGLILNTLPWTGIFVSLCILLGAGAAQVAIRSVADCLDMHNRRYMHEKWWNELPRHQEYPGLLGGGSDSAYWVGAVVPLVIPVVFIVIWRIILEAKFNIQ